jgi:hypothetical protein
MSRVASRRYSCQRLHWQAALRGLAASSEPVIAAVYRGRRTCSTVTQAGGHGHGHGHGSSTESRQGRGRLGAGGPGARGEGSPGVWRFTFFAAGFSNIPGREKREMNGSGAVLVLLRRDRAMAALWSRCAFKFKDWPWAGSLTRSEVTVSEGPSPCIHEPAGAASGPTVTVTVPAVAGGGSMRPGRPAARPRPTGEMLKLSRSI